MTASMLSQCVRRHARCAVEFSSSSNWCLKPFQQRTFSSSRPWQKPGVIPKFTKTSSEEVDTILSDVRNNYIIPAYLSAQQKELIIKAKHRKMLENDEVFANIGGERIHLTPMMERSRIPLIKSISEAIEKMNDKDVENMIPLLEGLMQTDARLPREEYWVRRIIKLFCNHNREDLVLAYVRQASDTGFPLANRGLVRAAMLSFLHKATKAEWEPAATKQALAWCEQLLDLLDDPKYKPLFLENDPRLYYTILSPPIFLAAKVAQQTGGEAEKKKLEDYVARMLRLKRTPLTTFRDDAKRHFWLLQHVTQYDAAQAALEVLDPGSEVGGELKEWSAKLKEDLDKIYNELVGTEWVAMKERAGMTDYEKTFGKR
ncbi:hypothetical protein HYFRA_00009382 [Hymenoscyphus fraxineus]|uniref:Uncharacterized protein n=1 Tax=Hymenoscyphus fraxineus TaxID=746836 RepID=A0A9N9L214_9HELO|nr:hypothetical protein HYFRA_00009382 [Hymenoscyphus fraxineus]